VTESLRGTKGKAVISYTHSLSHTLPPHSIIKWDAHERLTAQSKKKNKIPEGRGTT
jgi:hypothetical protein